MWQPQPGLSSGTLASFKEYLGLCPPRYPGLFYSTFLEDGNIFVICVIPRTLGTWPIARVLKTRAPHHGTIGYLHCSTETLHASSARAKVWLKANHDPSQNTLTSLVYFSSATCSLHLMGPRFCTKKPMKSFLIHLLYPLRVSQTCTVALPGWRVLNHVITLPKVFP